MSTSTFWKWFHQEREKRGLSIRKVESLGGVGESAISSRARYELPPTYENCRAIAKAFDLPVEDVLRKAGLLPPRYDEEPTAKRLLHLFSQLSEEEKEYVIKFAKALAEESEEENER